VHSDNYAQYRRRKAPMPGEVRDPTLHGNEFVQEPKRGQRTSRVLDNRYVVSHNKWLVAKYGAQYANIMCHIHTYFNKLIVSMSNGSMVTLVPNTS
jgi:hypothetical protein